MSEEEAKLVLDALIKSHVYLLHLPGRMFAPEEGEDCSRYSCFACRALSGQNHAPDCEVIALSNLVGEARGIVTRDFHEKKLFRDTLEGKL